MRVGAAHARVAAVGGGAGPPGLLATRSVGVRVSMRVPVRVSVSVGVPAAGARGTSAPVPHPTRTRGRGAERAAAAIAVAAAPVPRVGLRRCAVVNGARLSGRAAPGAGGLVRGVIVGAAALASRQRDVVVRGAQLVLSVRVRTADLRAANRNTL